jgi:hypothetical protein
MIFVYIIYYNYYNFGLLAVPDVYCIPKYYSHISIALAELIETCS